MDNTELARWAQCTNKRVQNWKGEREGEVSDELWEAFDPLLINSKVREQGHEPGKLCDL